MAYENEFYAQMDRMVEIELKEDQRRLKRGQNGVNIPYLYKGLCLENPI